MSDVRTDPRRVLLSDQIASLTRLGKAAALAYRQLAWLMSAEPDGPDDRLRFISKFHLRLGVLTVGIRNELTAALAEAEPWLGLPAPKAIPFVEHRHTACAGALLMVETIAGWVETLGEMSEWEELSENLAAEKWPEHMRQRLSDDPRYLPSDQIERLADAAREETQVAIIMATDDFRESVLIAEMHARDGGSDGMITIAQMAKLSGKSTSTIYRGGPPEPSIAGRGGRDGGKYLYSKLRTWMITQWPECNSQLPVSFDGGVSALLSK